MSGVKVFAIFVLLNLPYMYSVRSDCKTEQQNCTESYEQLVHDLMNTADNEYQLSTTFFPSTNDHPIIVTVEYCFVNTSLECKLWFWTSGKVYLYQPPRILQFITLWFSAPALGTRIGTVTLTLPSHCESVKEDFMETLTYRLKLYAQHKLEHFVIPDTYQAKAYSIDTMREKLYKNYYGMDMITLIYSTHFLFPLFVIIGLLVVGCRHLQYTKKTNKDQMETETDKEGLEPSDQVTVATITLISILFTVYVIFMDFGLLIAAYLDDKNTGLHDRFFTANEPLFVFPAVVAISDIVVVLVFSFCVFLCVPCLPYDRMFRVFIASVFCVFICLSFHIPFIISAWTTDSFHALTTLYWYIGVLTLDFITCKLAFEHRISNRKGGQTGGARHNGYVQIEEDNAHDQAGRDNAHDQAGRDGGHDQAGRDGDTHMEAPHQQYMNVIVFWDFIVAFFYVLAVTPPPVIVILYYVLLPFNETIEYAPKAFSSIFHLFVLVLTSIVAWKVIHMDSLDQSKKERKRKKEKKRKKEEKSDKNKTKSMELSAVHTAMSTL